MHPIRPILAISTGDPAGVGPEIAVKALNEQVLYERSKPLLICDAEIIRQILAICGLPQKVHVVDDPAKGIFTWGTIDVLDLHNINMQEFKFNTISAMTGKASYEYVAKAIDLALKGQVDATITGPIHKEAIQKAGYHFAGHTEIFAYLTGTQKYAMMLADESFRVVHVSTHVSLSEAIAKVKKNRIVEVIQLAEDALKTMGIPKPKIALAGLNPHAGENGLFGKEEIQEIIPAIQVARNKGIGVEGPFPPDTIFPKMKGGQYDLVVCMYHDQGHIPTKLLGFNYNHLNQRWEGLSGVNITLGLPIIRVSVDHGTAFDKGGKCEANPQSMIQALKYGIQFCMGKMNKRIAKD